MPVSPKTAYPPGHLGLMSKVPACVRVVFPPALAFIILQPSIQPSIDEIIDNRFGSRQACVDMTHGLYREWYCQSFR
jgi:hypothetical protein